VRWRYLAEALPELGWSVATVTAHVNPTADETSSDRGRAMLAAARARVMNSAGELARPLFRRAGVQPEAFAPNLAWSLTGRSTIARAIRRESPDVVWATAPPQSAIFAAVDVARRAGLPVVAELRDLWAGNPFFDAGGSLLARLEARRLALADAVVTVTPGCRQRLVRLHPELDPRLHLLPNGFDPALLELRQDGNASGSDRMVTLIHAGSLYGDRSAAPLVRALTRPDLLGRVRLQLLGTVDPATRAAQRAAGGQLAVVVDRPVHWRQAIDRIRDADISVVINSAGTGGAMALPSKLYEALALGRPVLALTPPGSDTDRLLRTLGQSWGLAAPDDEQAIAAAVAALIDRPPPAVAPEQLSDYDRAAVAGRLASLLDQLADGRSR
jgi:glycosyltransferase involved in cell wall biosynthesis